MTREQFSTLAVEMCADLATDMHLKMLKAFDALTEEEREKLDSPGKPYFLVRAIGVTVGPEVVNSRFNVEAIKSTIRRVKLILSHRRNYW